VEGVTDRRRAGSGLDPVRYLVARRLDDAGYGAGVWWGAWKRRNPDPLLLRLAVFEDSPARKPR
jgi:mycofactocin glycosyltransferase